MSKSDEMIMIERRRLDRVIEVLSVLSSGEFDAKELRIDVAREGGLFTQLEEILNAFTGELAGALSELRRTEETLREKLDTIDRQQLTIQDLSTPIIEIWDNILTTNCKEIDGALALFQRTLGQVRARLQDGTLRDPFEIADIFSKSLRNTRP